MTHRAGEEFTLIKLSDINKNTGAGSTDAPFLPFLETYIDPKSRQLLDHPDTEKILSDMYKNRDAIGFFDSLHDFKSDFFDCQSQIKGNSDIYSYKKFMFTFLLKGGYPNLFGLTNLLIQDKYSYLNRLPRPLNQDNLENYFSIGNIFDIIKKNTGKGKMYVLPQTRIPKTPSHKLAIYNKLKEFFASYRDSAFGNTIKLVVDMQLNLFDIIQTSRGSNRDFSILYTAETITDPAPKTKASKLDTIFGCENWCIESLTRSRMYDPVADSINGNVGIDFTNVQLSHTDDLEKADFSVDATYKYNNSASTSLKVRVVMNQKANTIQNIKNKINAFIKNLTSASTFTSTMFSKVISKPPKRVDFYKDFNTKIQSDITDNYLKEYTIDYARKRLGDTLQGRVCLLDKLGNLRFKNVTKNGKKFTLGSDEKIATTGAVLVTHDRMLFSYAVINNIPTILDLQEHMIVFVPTQSSRGGGEEEPLVEDEPLVAEEQMGGNIYNFSDMADSIFDNVDDLIRFMYFFQYQGADLNNAGQLLDNVNTALRQKTLGYAYVGEYDLNCLVIAPISEIDGELTTIHDYVVRTSPRLAENDPTYFELRNNPTFLYIKLNDDNYIKVTRTNVPSIIIIAKLNGSTEKSYTWSKRDIELRLGVNSTPGVGVISKLESQTGSIDEDINHAKFDDFELYIENPKHTIVSLFKRVVGVSVIGLGIFAAGLGMAATGVVAGPVALATAGVSSYYAPEATTKLGSFVASKITGSRGGGPNDAPFFQLILQSKFESLNEPKNLLPNNITVLYFLFNLLQTYETSFISYQEGIDTFYTKIDESCILSDMIGVTNLIPHNIEFYVFLKLILQDYSENNIKNINYALFEYYLYIFKTFYNVYDQFQSIKSYLLNVNYNIETSEDIIRNISENNAKSLKYFQSVLRRADEISTNIISKNYDATQEGNFDIIHKNANDYSLKLRGFMDMKGEFMVKTYDIIESMAAKGLLLQYTEKAELEGVGSSTSEYKTSTPDDIIDRQEIAVSNYGGKKASMRKNRRKIKKSRKFRKHGSKKTLKNNRKRRRKTTKKY